MKSKSVRIISRPLLCGFGPVRVGLYFSWIEAGT